MTDEREREMVANDFASLAEFVKGTGEGGGSVVYKLTYALPLMFGDVAYFHNRDITDMVERAAKALLINEASDKEVDAWIVELAHACRRFAKEVKKGAISVFVLPPLP